MGKKLAIRGHSTRGKEVIELLEMMGGKNIHKRDGEAIMYSYYISGNVILNDRLSIAEDDDFEIFTLQDFLEKFPFKVHDLVNIPEYESTVGICGMKWDPYSKHMEYMVYRCDDEEWYTAEELLNYNDNPNETTDCKKYSLNKGSVQCFNNMYDWKFDERTGGIFTGRHDMFGVEIYEGNKVETPLGIGIVRYNPKYWRFEIAEENEPLDNVREDAGRPEECWVVIS